MYKYLIWVLIMYPAAGCLAQGGKAPDSSIVRLVEEEERGKPFTLDVMVLDIDTRQPIAGARIYAYHTNYKGDYERDAKGEARIHGTGYSSKEGKLTFITIYPRGYNDSPSGSHIHFHGKAQGYRTGEKDLGFDGTRGIPATPQPHRVYLLTIEEKDGKLKGTAVLFFKKV